LGGADMEELPWFPPCRRFTFRQGATAEPEGLILLSLLFRLQFFPNLLLALSVVVKKLNLALPRR
jgi:hypothetical protein